MKSRITMQDVVVSYVIGFPIAVTLIFTWMVLKSNGIFVVNMMLYNEFYFEASLFILWILLFAVKAPTINNALKLYAVASRGQ